MNNLESTATKILDELENETSTTPPLGNSSIEQPTLDTKELIRLYKKFKKKSSKKGTYNYRKCNAIPIKDRAKKYKAMRKNQKLARRINRNIYNGR